MKTADDLMDNPTPMFMGGGDEGSPWHEALRALTVTEDEPLEIVTRTNPILAKACAISYSMVATFRSSYVSGRNNQNMRLAVSKDGRGREEIVRSLGADSETFNKPENPIQDDYAKVYEDE